MRLKMSAEKIEKANYTWFLEEKKTKHNELDFLFVH